MTAPDPQTRSPEPWLTPGRLLTLVGVLVGTYLTLVIVRALRGVLIMLMVALFLSFAMEPAVQWLNNRGVRRGLATGVVFLLALLIMAGLVIAMIPLVVEQIGDLIVSAPRSVEDLNRLAERLPFVPNIEVTSEVRMEVQEFGREFGDRIRAGMLGAAGNVINLGATALGAMFQLLAIGLITFYLVADGPRLRQTLARPFPADRQREILAIWELAVAKTGGYIYSRVLLAVASALAHLLVLMLLGVPFALPLALWVGVTSAFIPVVGTYLGGILLLLVALVNEPMDALWLLIFIGIYQQIENYLLAPTVQSRTMDVHPAVAFVSVLIGGTLLGAPGALLALPATAIIQALLSTYVRRHELIDELREIHVPEPPTPKRSRKQVETEEAPA
jgi:predicted PurR-regulated permease PerM